MPAAPARPQIRLRHPGPRRLAACCLALLFAGPPLATHVSAAGEASIGGVVRCHGVPGCAGAVVYVERASDRSYPPGHAVMDQVRLRFTPHVLPVVRGTVVTFPNSDDVRHNVFSPSTAKRFNLGTYPKGVTKQVAFDTPGVVELLCNVHPEMSAYIIVADTPFAAFVAADGSYALPGVPAGTYTVVAWHEMLSAARQVVTVGDGGTVALDFELRP